MNKAETIDQIAKDAAISKTAAQQMLNVLETSIKTHIDTGERILLRGLGSFTRGEATQRTGHNPRTGEPLTYTGYRRTTGAPLFSESKLIAEISNNTGQTENATRMALDAFKAALKGALKKGDIVTLLGFGSFYVGKRAARNGRNPQTGATIRIPAAQVPKFRASRARNKGGKFNPAAAMKEAVN